MIEVREHYPISWQVRYKEFGCCGRPVTVVAEHPPLAPIHPVSGFEGSYVAVAGDPGRRGAVHVVENVRALGKMS